jgi:myo-inositol 2-dehydrogenase / D-chiro-inositol 1-dehydrogenase
MKKLKVGVVGLGRLGSKHAENIAFHIPNVELTAVCARTKEKVEKVQKEWDVPYGYTDYHEMFQNEELDAVVIASSSTEHCKQSEAALKAGLHVFCEKPLGVTIEECKRIEAVVEAHQEQVYMLGFMRRYDPAYSYAKKKIEEGVIGTPILTRCYSLDPDNLIDGLLAFAGTSGGLFIDMGVHDIDLARWFLGADAESVYALGDCYLHEELKQHGDIDNGTAIMKFTNGTIGLFYSGRTAPHGYHIETEIVGTHGTLRVSPVPEKNQVMIFDDHGAVHECVPDFLERFDKAFVLELQEFVNCITEKRPPTSTVYDGTKATEIAYAAVQSLKNEDVVYLGT